MSTRAPIQKLQKLRTFKDDLSRAKDRPVENAAVQETKPAQIPSRSTHHSEIKPISIVSEDKSSDEVKKIEQAKPITQTPPKPVHTPAPTHIKPQPVKPAALKASSTAATPSQNEHKAAVPSSFIADDLAKIRTHKNASVLSTEDEVFEMSQTQEAANEGSIITDTKRDRFNLFKEIKKSLTQWLFQKKETYEEYKRPKHTVTPSFARKDIIERAVTTSSTTPKDDHHIVAHRLRNTPRTNTVQELSIKKADEVQKPTWEHVTDAQTNEEKKPIDLHTKEKQHIHNAHTREDKDPALKETDDANKFNQKSPDSDVNKEKEPEPIVSRQEDAHVKEQTKPKKPLPENNPRSGFEATPAVGNVAHVPTSLKETPAAHTETGFPTQKFPPPVEPEPDTVPPSGSEENHAPAPVNTAKPEREQVAAQKTPPINDSVRSVSSDWTAAHAEPVAEQIVHKRSLIPTPKVEKAPSAQQPTISSNDEETIHQLPQLHTKQKPMKEGVQSVPPTTRSHSKFSVFSVVVIGIIASIFGVGVSVWLLWDSSSSTPSTVPTHETTPLLLTDIVYDIPLGQTHEQMMSNFAEAITQTPHMSTATLRSTIVTAERSERPATVAEVLSIFSPRAPGNFLRTITGIEFGSYRGSEPYIILKVTSFDAALGGMLAWEPAMSSDLAPLFGNPVTSTFDPSARTATQTRDPFFVDVVHANRDVRVLRDDAQKDRIVYSLLNRTTILISTDRTIIEELAPHVR